MTAADCFFFFFCPFSPLSPTRSPRSESCPSPPGNWFCSTFSVPYPDRQRTRWCPVSQNDRDYQKDESGGVDLFGIVFVPEEFPERVDIRSCRKRSSASEQPRMVTHGWKYKKDNFFLKLESFRHRRGGGINAQTLISPFEGGDLDSRRVACYDGFFFYL